MADGLTIEYLSMRPNLAVRDVAASVEFYRDVIGLELAVAFDDGSFALLRRDGAELALVRDPAPVKHGAYLYVIGVEALRERCIAAGHAATPLVREPWGLLDFVVTDPDGHQIAIGEHRAR